jgi:putative ABC transport system permease protein
MLDFLGIPRRVTVARFIAALFGVFGVLAVGLACMGVYGIVAQAVADRRRDIAIRIALGATPRQIVRALLREHNVLVLLGVAIGLAIAALTMGWIGEFLGTVGYVGLAVYGIMCIVLFGTIVITALIPAVRATRMGPMEVLRAE